MRQQGIFHATICLCVTLVVSVPAVAAGTRAQTNVDKVVRALDSLGTISFNDWKVSPDLKSLRSMTGDPTKAGFDDSKWEVLKLDQLIYPDSCWIRKEIVLPDRILGRPVKGPLKFLVSVDDYGYLWVNGQSKGYFPWDGEFEITRDAKPGEKFLIAIKAINTGGPLRLIRARVETDEMKPFHQKLEDFSMSLQVGQKLVSFDTYQTNAHKREDHSIDKSTLDKGEKTKLNDLLQSLAGRVDLDALAAGTVDKFTASLEAARAQMQPIGTFAKQFTLYFDANAHIDAAWLWRDKETIEVCKNTFTSVLNMMDARPDFTYTQSAAAYYDWMERLSPDVFARMQQRVKDGRWEVVGGMWVEPDCNLPSGESWMHHLLYSTRYFAKKFGTKVKIGWNPDSFGYNWNMPEFYANAGVDAFITQKMGWSEQNIFPYHLFWWESPDGSRVLCYFPFDYVNEVNDPVRTVDQLRQFEANSGVRKMLILFGVGDHGGGPSNEMLDRIEHLKTLDIFPTIENGTASGYLDWLRKGDLSKLPVWNDELYLEYHQGTYTTQAKMKESNRREEALLTNAEKFSTIATMSGGSYNRNDLEEAWRNVLFNQFHDLLPGSGIRENYIDAAEKYKAAGAIGNVELNKSIHQISRQVNTSAVKKALPVIVFNALSWERNDIGTVQLPEGDNAEYALYDMAGKEIPSQALRTGKYSREILFKAEQIPSLGYKLYEMRKQKPAAAASALAVTRTSLENEFFRVTIDPDSGWVKSIVDKRNNKELLAGFGGEVQLLEDKPRAWDAWNIGLTGVKYPTKLRSIEVAESGPVRASIRIVRDYLKPGVRKDPPTPEYPSSFFSQEIMLYRGVDRIDFKTDADWWEEKTMIKVAFPVTVKDTAATYEIPYGTIRRSTQFRNSWDSAKVEVAAQRWADLSDGQYGISLLNKSKYGYDIKGSVMRLSLLRSPVWPDPTADRGKHTIEYSLYPHKGGWREAQTVQRGYEYNNPLIATIGEAHKGTLPGSNSFVTLSPSNLVLTEIKKAEDSEAWIVQWYDAGGEGGQAQLTLPRNPKKVVVSNFLEEDGTVIAPVKNTVSVPTKKNSIVTLKISF
ncbi:MAG TPA: glycoside hydrolase family 38 C-terminal domain-containing protein [Bacteroidota bacterium]|jgi:alpha-mannosidase